jgi:hypothetical protein
MRLCHLSCLRRRLSSNIAWSSDEHNLAVDVRVLAHNKHQRRRHMPAHTIHAKLREMADIRSAGTAEPDPDPDPMSRLGDWGY